MVRRFARIGWNALLRSLHGNKLSTSCKVALGAEIRRSYLGDGVQVARGASVRASKINAFTSIGRSTKITHADIGSYCAISWDVTINALAHPYTHLTSSAFPYVPALGQFVSIPIERHIERVEIGHDVWIGAHSVILPGIRIGHGAVVGAGAVVTKHVPPYAIVVGVPARVVRFRFSRDVIEQLLEIRWWDFPQRVIRQHIDLFQGDFTKDKLARLRAVAATVDGKEQH